MTINAKTKPREEGTTADVEAERNWLSESMLRSAGRTRSEAVLEVLRAALLDGQFRPGERLMEQTLSKVLNVSRTPIRTALYKLSGEGLLDHEPNRGYIARGFTLRELTDAYGMRSLAEGMAARLAAERGFSPEASREMEDVLARGDAGLGDDTPEMQARKTYAEVNAAFHGLIQQASNSRLVADVIRVCQSIPQTSAANLFQFTVRDARKRHRDHHRIYEAILCQQPKEAETLMRAHVASVRTAIIRAFARKNISGSVDLAEYRSMVETTGDRMAEPVPGEGGERAAR